MFNLREVFQKSNSSMKTIFSRYLQVGVPDFFCYTKGQVGDGCGKEQKIICLQESVLKVK
jgi:hypothetical protein